MYQRIIKNPLYNQKQDQHTAIRIIVTPENIFCSVLQDVEFAGNVGCFMESSAIQLDNKELLEEKSLYSYRAIGTRSQDYYFEFDGRRYVVYNDIVINKKHPYIRNLWTPGSIICVLFDQGGRTTVLGRDEISHFSHCNALQIKRDYIMFQNLVRIYVTDQTKDLTHYHISIQTNTNDRVFSNVNFENIVDWNSEYNKDKADFEFRYLMECDQKSIEPNQFATVKFYIIDGLTNNIANINYDGYIVDPVIGYVPNRRVKVVNGVGTFKIMALGVESGENLRVKVRTPAYSSLAECVIPVR